VLKTCSLSKGFVVERVGQVKAEIIRHVGVFAVFWLSLLQPMVHSATTSWFWCFTIMFKKSTSSHNQHQKQLPQPQLQPNKPQTTTQTKNQAQNTTIQPTCAHKTPTTTTKEETNPIKQPEKKRVQIKQTNNDQKEKPN
jgi:cytoskeletal protein RodZ